jgi:hypothetical protein
MLAPAWPTGEAPPKKNRTTKSVNRVHMAFDMYPKAANRVHIVFDMYPKKANRVHNVRILSPEALCREHVLYYYRPTSCFLGKIFCKSRFMCHPWRGSILLYVLPRAALRLPWAGMLRPVGAFAALRQWTGWT